jgi:hypothetical protein
MRFARKERVESGKWRDRGIRGFRIAKLQIA